MQDYDHQPGELRKLRNQPTKREPGRDERNLAFASLVGNRAIQRLLESGASSRNGRGAVGDSVQRRIDDKRGSGSSIDGAARRPTERALGQDFSDVRVHDDPESDHLSRSLHARAFTTGNDIFFKSGLYDPNSGAGQKLLTHELTHVFQQRTAGVGAARVSDANDASEHQAHQVADAVAAGSHSGLAGLKMVAPAGIARETDEEDDVDAGAGEPAGAAGSAGAGEEEEKESTE